MKNVSGALVTFLQNNTAVYSVDLFTITCTNGTVLRYTSLDRPVVYGGNTFLSGPPNFSREKIEQGIGLNVKPMTFIIQAGPTDFFGSTTIPILQAIGLLYFDKAQIRVDRVIFDSQLNQQGGFIIFMGQLGEVDELSYTHAKFIAHSVTEELNQQYPRRVIQPPCTHTLFDTGCTLNPATFTKASTVIVGSTVNKILCGLTDPTTTYDKGRIVFTSGANLGLIKSVKQYVAGSPSIITFDSPLPFAPSAGDTFNAIFGCDHLQPTCSGKFNNLVNFGGFPYVPIPESTL